MARQSISDTQTAGTQIYTISAANQAINGLDGNAATAYEFTGSGYVTGIGANRVYAYLQIPGLSTGNYVNYTRRYYGSTAGAIGTSDGLAAPTWAILVGLVDFANGDGYLNFKGIWSTALVGGRMPYQFSSAWVVNTANSVMLGNMVGAYIAPNANNITSLNLSLGIDPGGAAIGAFSGFKLKVEPLFSH